MQSNTREAERQAKFDTIAEASVVSANRRILLRAIMTFVIIFFAFTGVVIVLWIGARDVRSGIMTPGELVQFVIFATMVAGGVAALSEIWGELLRAAGAAERLVELLETDDSIRDPETPVQPPTPFAGTVEFSDVRFRYPMRPERLALDNVSFRIGAGETVALVGPSGAGKSTIFQLLLRFSDPESGRVELDGVDVKSMNRSDFRQLIALVPQDPGIFAESAKENIRFGRIDATDDEIVNAAKAGAAHEFLTEFGDGYGTFLGERGVTLSGGQKQRIALARAIIRDAPILLLDEATSSLDAESELAVQNAVERLSKGQTTVIIAHRLATVKKADRILVLDKGKIVEEGTHDSLVAKSGLYARLARLQFTDGVLN